jgi:hypothetical protein
LRDVFVTHIADLIVFRRQSGLDISMNEGGEEVIEPPNRDESAAIIELERG